MPEEQGSITFVPSVHYSQAHVRRVEEKIREVEPDVVAVELDDRRFKRMDRGEEADPMEVAKELPGPAGLAYLAFSKIQESVVRFQGMETEDTDMNAALRTAAMTDTPVALIDDPMTDTFTNIVDNVSIEDIPEIMARQQEMDPEQIEEMQEAQKRMMENREEVEHGDDVQEMVDNMREFAPGFTEAILDNRDRAMAERLHKIRENGYDAVAVIGAAHHNGILDHLEAFDAEDVDLDAEVPVRESEKDVRDIPIN